MAKREQSQSAQHEAAEAPARELAEMKVGPHIIRENDPPEKWVSNLEAKTEMGMARLLNATNPPSMALTGAEPLRFRLRYYVIMLADAEDRETGEVTQAPKTVLMTDDGKTFVTRGRHAPDKIMNMVAIFGPPRWAAGIPIIVREHRSPRTKNTSHVIEIDLTGEW